MKFIFVFFFQIPILGTVLCFFFPTFFLSFFRDVLNYLFRLYICLNFHTRADLFLFFIKMLQSALFIF